MTFNLRILSDGDRPQACPSNIAALYTAMNEKAQYRPSSSSSYPSSSRSVWAAPSNGSAWPSQPQSTHIPSPQRSQPSTTAVDKSVWPTAATAKSAVVSYAATAKRNHNVCHNKHLPQQLPSVADINGYGHTNGISNGHNDGYGIGDDVCGMILSERCGDAVANVPPSASTSVACRG